MRVALLQLNVSDDPEANLELSLDLVARAAAEGAQLIATPEMTNALSSSRDHQRAIFTDEASDPTLAALRAAARGHGLWMLIGSLGLTSEDPDGRFANRSFLIGPDGAVVAHYDKIHMFDVNVSETEVYRESAGYRPGARAVVAPTPFGGIGMAVCYDLRFAHLFRALAQAGARILSIPAAFNDTTGAAHWETLLRARAIETGCFVIAPAQTGLHADRHARRARRSWGHSMVVAPWGEVLLDAGTEPGLHLVDLDLGAVDRARARVPSLNHDRAFAPPEALT